MYEVLNAVAWSLRVYFVIVAMLSTIVIMNVAMNFAQYWADIRRSRM